MKQHYSILLSFLLSLAFSATYAQGESHVWYFGNKAGIAFNGDNVTAVTNGQLSAIEGCTSISDASGNLRFYTNGITVWNKNHVAMTNGTGLFADPSSTQAAVIVPKPGDANIYYIFTTNPFQNNAGLRYSIVDMSLSGGNGAVTTKNALIYEGTCEKIAVVRHSNGQNYWVLTHRYGSNGFQANLVTSGGISPTVVNSNSGAVVNAETDPTNAVGYMNLSPDGSKLIVCHTYPTVAAQNRAELFDFDAQTGIVTNPRILFTDMHPYGAAFSGEGNAFYISCYEEKKIFQFSLAAADIAASKTLVAETAHHPAAMQIGPDGKIYVAMAEHDKLSVISHPDVIGTGCAVMADAVDLAGRMCFLGLPAFDQSQFNLRINHNGHCSGYPTDFSFQTPFAASSYLWDFGDGTTSNEATPAHVYASAGTYPVTVTIMTTAGLVSRATSVQIISSGQAFAIPDQSLCIGDGAVYTLSENDHFILGNQSASVFDVAYFASASDAAGHVNALPNVLPVHVGTQTIFAKLFNVANPGCYALTSFSITCFKQPVAAAVSDFTACDTGSADGFTAFDLSEKDAEILAGQAEGDFFVRYFTSENDAYLNESAIGHTFYNTSNPQTVYARIENSEGGCSTVVSFQLVVENCHTTVWDYPKFFTPNGDGFNDRWEIKSTSDNELANVAIFDRYGKLVAMLASNDYGWDGTFGGNTLPSTDYWFVATTADGRELRGHFALKR